MRTTELCFKYSRTSEKIVPKITSREQQHHQQQQQIGTLPPSPTIHLLLQQEKARNKEEVPKVWETPSETFTFPVLHRENGNFKIDTFRCKSEPQTFVPVTFPISFVLVMVCTSFSTLLFYCSKGEQIHVYRRYLFPVKTQFSAGKWLFFQTRPRTSLDMTAIHSTMMIKIQNWPMAHSKLFFQQQ